MKRKSFLGTTAFIATLYFLSIKSSDALCTFLKQRYLPNLTPSTFLRPESKPLCASAYVKSTSILATTSTSSIMIMESNPCSTKSQQFFKGKNILVTGASGGLGKSLAFNLARCGASMIILSGREDEKLKILADEINALSNDSSESSTKAVYCTCDLSDLGAVQEFGKKALELCSPGTVDVLINNGGISSRSSFLDTKIDVDELLMKVNYLSGAALAKIVTPGMKKMGEGTIIWISSVQGLVGIPNRTSYAASKFAVQGYCEALRAELASDGITVHVASPGYIRTNLSNSAITGDGSLYGKMDDTTANGSDSDLVAVEILDGVAQGKADMIVAASVSARLAIWLRFLTPSLLQSLLVKRFDKSRK